jgi:putative ABC transport system permease protein
VGLAVIVADLVDIGGTAGVAVILVPVAAIFLGVAMLSSLLAVPAARAIAWIPARVRGMTGVLARENTIRNPRRTASAAAALMVGLALMTLVAIFGASITKSLDEVLESDVKAELLLSTENFFPSSPQAAAAVREALPEAEVTEFRFGLAEIDGDTKGILGVDTNLDRTLNVRPAPGAVRRFQDGGLLLFEDTYKELPAAVRRSGRLPIRFAATGEQQVVIAGTFSKKEAVGNDYLLAMPTYAEHFRDQADVFTAVRLPPGLSERRAGRIIERALEPFPNVNVESRAEFAEAQKAQIGQFLNLIYLLLALAVAIALLGIANTLTLSVFERTKELGLLRAVGMTRQQLRRMVRYESLIIAVFGSLLGLALGLVFGRAILAAFESEGITFAVPVPVLVLFLVAGGLFGYWAGRWPARRAARLDVLRAVGTD